MSRLTEPSAPSRLLARFRWLFMPLGLSALVAVGVHAAADTVDDKLLWAVDLAQSRWDAFWSQWAWAQRLVSPMGLTLRTELARGLTLLWELGSDLVLVLPMLGYREGGERLPSLRWLRQPSVLRITRPLFTAAVVVAGACSIAQLVQGTAYLALQGEVPSSAANAWSRLAAILALGLVALSLGWRAVLQSLRSADAKTEEARASGEHVLAGAFGSLWVAPLAVAAVLDAAPLLAFFR